MKVTSTANLVTDSVGDLTLEEEVKPKTFKQMTNSERFKFVKEVITVEPIVAAYFVAGNICGTALNALETEKACKSDASFPDFICDAIVAGRHANYSSENIVQQEIRADLNSWAFPIQNFAPAILVIFLGSYSDRHKLRKPFIIIPMIGELFAVTGCILNAIFMKELPVLALVLMNGILSSLFGSLSLFVMAIYAYIAEVSNLEMRTLRIGIIQITLTVSNTIGQYLTGPLFLAIGYLGVFGMAGVLYLSGILYTAFMLKESRQQDSTSEKKVGFCRDLFNTKDITDTLSLLVRKTIGCNRLFLIMVIIVWICMRTSQTGAVYIGSFYTQSVLTWSPQAHSLYTAISTTVSLIGTALGVALFTKVIKLSDYNLVNLSLLNGAICEIIYAFSTTPLMFYIGCVVGMFGGLSLIGIRSISTKIVQEEHMGKVQSFMAVGEAVSGALAGQYNHIYIYTAKTFPGAFYLVSSLLSCAAGFLVLWLNVLVIRKDKKKSESESKGNDLETNGMQMMNTTHI